MYHWEADQADFLVVSGEALLIVEGEAPGGEPLGMVEEDDLGHGARA